MANEVSVHRVSQLSPSVKFPATTKTDVHKVQTTAENAEPRHSASALNGQAKALNGVDLQTAVERLDQLTRALTRAVRHELQFSIDEETGRSVIKVIDSESKEVLKEIPSEELLALIAHFEDSKNGFLDEKA